MREERRLRLFENRVLRRVFGPKRDEVTGNGENYIMRTLVICTARPIIFWVKKSRRMRGAWHVARMGRRRGVYRVLVGKPEGKRPFGKPRHRWEYNIKMNLQGMGNGVRTGSSWLKIGQVASTCESVMNIQVPQNAGNFLTSWKPVIFSRRTLLHRISE